MANSPLEIRSRVNLGTPLKTTFADSPLSRLGPRSPLKPSPLPASLSLRRIIGTTTSSSSGLACHYASSSFAYCAGSAAVLAKVDATGEISYRFFRAQPTALPVHPCVSFYNPTTPTALPESRRRMIVPLKHGLDERSSIKSPRRIWGDDGSPKTWSARERVKAVSCVDLSCDGRFLAVGETGYSPRVNIFSTLASAAADIPLTILTEHSFGVRFVAFSPNLRWLATLGDVNDGFLFIWSINPKTGAARLQFTNKCTAAVLGMAWCANKLITVGTRYVKVWRVGEPSSGIQSKPGRMFPEGDGSPAPRTLSGRNSLLGCLADSTFTCVAAISDCEAILCTKTGCVCLLDDRTGNQELKYIRQLDHSTKSAAVDLQAERIWYVSRDGDLSSESFESLRSAGGDRLVTGSSAREQWVTTTSRSSLGGADPLRPLRSPPRAGCQRRNGSQDIVASGCLPGRIVSVDELRNIRLEVSHGVKLSDTEPLSVVTLPAHNGAVQGVFSLPEKSALGDYVTWSLEGAVNFWSLDGSLMRSEKVELEQPKQSSADLDEYVNELRHVRLSEAARSIVVGDRLGVLQVIHYQSRASLKVRVHSAEITDIAVDASEQPLLMATSSRDRTVQLLQHREEEIELLQTFDDHVGAVIAVSFIGDGLVSASSDRTVIVRQKVHRTNDDGTRLLAYVPKRVITLKAAPTSIACPEPDILVVSTLDRKILTFSAATGVAMDGFKTFDADGEDAVILSSLCISSMKDLSGSRSILAGFSSTDKSIRLYDYDRGTLLARELGHTEGISGIALLHHTDAAVGDGRKTIVSTGLDGLVMVWDAATAPSRVPSTPLQELSQGPASTISEPEDTPTSESLLRRPPLRKVLSKLDLADISGSAPPASSHHDQSPPRLKKKTSRHGLAPRKVSGLPAVPRRSETLATRGGQVAGPDSKRIESPSPLPRALNAQTAPQPTLPSATKMVARQEAAAMDQAPSRPSLGMRSPSPRPMPPSLSTTAKAVHRANKGRLRRPPSVPSDLRGQSHAQSRRKSMGSISEFGSAGMASEQLCRTLRAYRKKIRATPRTEQLQLDELEVELLATLQAVEERHGRN